MPARQSAEIRDLGREEIEAILGRNHLGRIGYSFHDRVNVEPVHYVYDGSGWIYGRTSPGEKLTTIRHHPWVAFEVDEEDALFDWRSVVVHGGFYLIDPEGSPQDREPWEAGVAALRTLVPAAFTADDPAPFRTVVFRIPLQEVVGRASTLDLGLA